MYEVKKDCFAYVKSLNKCKALNELYCRVEDCKFYKTTKERCDGCKKAKGRVLTCAECKIAGYK